MWYDYENGFVYRYGGADIYFASPPTAWNPPAVWRMNLTAVDNTTGDFVGHNWFLIRSYNLSSGPVYDSTSGAVPNPGRRVGSVTFLDSRSRPGDTLLWLYGGMTPLGYFEDVWYFSVNSAAWTYAEGPKVAVTGAIPSGRPTPRILTTLVPAPDGKSFIMTGGTAITIFNNQLQAAFFRSADDLWAIWAFSLETFTWRSIPVRHSPSIFCASRGIFWDDDAIYLSVTQSYESSPVSYALGPQISMLTKTCDDWFQIN
jgi:hypothetical protein